MEYYLDKEVLIFGGLGYTGPKLAKKLVELGAKVTIVARSAEEGSDKHKRYPEIYKVANVVSLDPFADFESLKEHIDKADVILNLIHGEKESSSYQQKTVTFNFKILDYCKENKLNPVLVQFGSRLEYLNGCESPIKEDSELKPNSIYGFGKLVSERYYQFFNQQFGLRTICFRISNVYGSVEELELKKNTADAIICSALNKEIKIDQDINRFKDFIHIDDFVDVVLLSIKNEGCYGKVFNIGGDEKISLKDLAEKINSTFSPQKKVTVLDDVNKDDLSFLLDVGFIKEVNNWKPNINIDEGLQRIKKQLENK
jgi:UDP-glucose 4-epimerase